MTLDPVLINQWLDVILRIILLAIMVSFVYLIWNIEKTVSNVNRTADELQEKIRNASEFVIIGKLLRWLYRRKRREKR